MDPKRKQYQIFQSKQYKINKKTPPIAKKRRTTYETDSYEKNFHLQKKLNTTQI